MNLQINVTIDSGTDDDLIVPFKLLQFVLDALYGLRRAYTAGEARLQLTTGDSAFIPNPQGIGPTFFKIQLIKMLRSVPGQSLDLRDAKRIVEFALENATEIEQLGRLV